jgi:hypothetical protein
MSKLPRLFNRLTTFVVILILISATLVHGDEPKSLSILTWNIESPGSNPEVIANQLEELIPFDILALSEVPETSTDMFVTRWGSEASLVGTSGGQSRLLLAWNPAKLECLNKEELKTIDGKGFGPGNQIAPLVAHLKHLESGFEFKVVMNKLHRGSDTVRKTQALLLCDWGKQQTTPCIAVGGYNFDFDFNTKKGNAAFEAFMETKVWDWVEPKEWIDNNWADNNRDGKDDYPDSLLDFVFTTQWDKAKPTASITCQIIQRDGDFPDSDQTSDFRPIRTIVHLK